MKIEHLQHVTTELTKIEEFVKNSNATFDDILEHVDTKLYELKIYAVTNNVALHVDAYTLVSKYHDEPESDEYSSSYYEDDSSYYDEEEKEEEGSWD